MKTKDAIDYFQSKTRLAEALGIQVSAVSQWGEDVPARRALELEKLTGGALQAAAEAGRPKRPPGMLATTAA